MREYELVTIFPPGEEPELPTEVVERISTLIGNHDGEVRGVYHWGKRRFAYPINKMEEGFYVLFKLNLSPEQVRILDESLSIEQNLLRHLLVKDPGGYGPVLKPVGEAATEESSNDR